MFQTGSRLARGTVVLPALLLLSACGGGVHGASSVAGNYTCTESILDALKLTADGHAYVTATLLGERLEKAGTYRLDGDKVIVMIDPPPMPEGTVFTRSGDTLDGGLTGKCTRR